MTTVEAGDRSSNPRAGLMRAIFRRFRKVHVLDTEFRTEHGILKDLHCAVGFELRNREWNSSWIPDGERPDIQRDDLVIAFGATAERQSMDWLGLPDTALLDLRVEFIAAHAGLMVGKPKAKDEKRGGCPPTPRGNHRYFTGKG